MIKNKILFPKLNTSLKMQKQSWGCYWISNILEKNAFSFDIPTWNLRLFFLNSFKQMLKGRSLFYVSFNLAKNNFILSIENFLFSKVRSFVDSNESFLIKLLLFILKRYSFFCFRVLLFNFDLFNFQEVEESHVT